MSPRVNVVVDLSNPSQIPLRVANSLKRVGFFVPGWPPQHYPNGIVSYVANLRIELEKRGIASSILALQTQGTIAPDVIDLSKISKFESWYHRILRKVARNSRSREDSIDLAQFGRTVAAGAQELYRRAPFDLFEIEESFGLAEYVRKKLEIPVVLRLHGPWFINGRVLGVADDFLFEQRNQAEGQAIRNAIAISSPSQDTLARVRDEFSCPLSTARVIPNLGPPISSDQQWSLSESDPNMVLFVGRFDRHKGGDLILKAFVDIAAKLPKAYLVFVGPDRGFIDENYQLWTFPDYKTKLTEDASILDRIHYKGTLATREIQTLRTLARVTVVASRDEIFGMTVLESLAYGCPLVASKVGGIPELVRHENNGLLFDPRRKDELGNHITNLLNDPERCLSLSEQAKIDYENRLSPRILSEETVNFYEDVLQNQVHSPN